MISGIVDAKQRPIERWIKCICKHVTEYYNLKHQKIFYSLRLEHQMEPRVILFQERVLSAFL